MKVRITKCSHIGFWYENLIGREFNVRYHRNQTLGQCYISNVPELGINGWVDIGDCVKVTKEKLAHENSDTKILLRLGEMEQEIASLKKLLNKPSSSASEWLLTLCEAPISFLTLTTRLRNILSDCEVITIGDLYLKVSPADLRRFRNFGKTSYQQLEKALSAHGLSFDTFSNQEVNFVRGKLSERQLGD